MLLPDFWKTTDSLLKMGFGFNLFFVLVLVPLTIILSVCWLLTRRNGYGKLLGLIWSGVIGLVFISLSIQALMAKKTLRKKDFYGEYVIDRTLFRGKQADWQYDNFHFEIKENDSIYLSVCYP